MRGVIPRNECWHRVVPVNDRQAGVGDGHLPVVIERKAEEVAKVHSESPAVHHDRHRSPSWRWTMRRKAACVRS